MFSPTQLTRWTVTVAGLLGVIVLLVGALRVARQQHQRQELAAQIAGRVAEWHLQLASELPPAQRAEWLALSASEPVDLLRACAIETKLPLRDGAQLH
jgi:hypothetical protein